MTSYLYTEGMKASVMGDAEAAEALFEEVTALDSTHAAAWFQRASIAANSAPERALDYARKAVALDGANHWYSTLYGRLMVLSGHYAQAREIYQELVRSAPHNPENHRMLAALYQQQGEPYAAIATLRQAENRLGRHEAFEQMLGELYLRVGQDSLALDAFQNALTLNPESGEALGMLAGYYRAKNHLADFFATARRLIASPKVTLDAKLRMVDELRDNRPFYQANFYAIRDLVDALWLRHPADWEVIDRYGMTLAAAGGAEAALEFFKKQLAADSVPIAIFTTTLDLLAYLRQSDSLARYTQLALRQYPHNPDLYLRLGSAYAYLDRSPQALDAYRQALRHAPSDSLRSVVYGVIGDRYHADSNFAQCYRYYDRALKADPDNAMVLNNFAYYLATDPARTRDLPRAIAMAERATALETGNATFLDTHAWALYRAGRLPEAKKIMQQAISLDTDASETLYDHYGDILAALGERLMARLYYQKALDKTPDNAEIRRKLNALK